MKQGEMNIQLSVKEIVEACCPECKLKVRELVKNKITDQMVDKVLGVDHEK